MMYEIIVMLFGLGFAGFLAWQSRRDAKRLDDRTARTHHPAE